MPPVGSHSYRLKSAGPDCFLSITSATSQQAWKHTLLHTGCARASGTTESEHGRGLTAEWTHVRTLLIMLKIVLHEGMDFVDPLKYRRETQVD